MQSNKKLRDIRCALAHFGGNWNNGLNAGPSYWNLNNSSGNANVNYGRQTLVSENFKIFCILYSSPIVSVGYAKKVVSMHDKAYNLCAYS